MPTPGGSVPALVRRLRSGGVAQQLQALNALQTACKGKPEACRAAAAEGAIPLVVRLLNSSVATVAAAAAAVLLDMGGTALELRQAMLAAGTLPALVPMFGSNSEEAQASAANALMMLCHNDAEVTRAAAAAGGIPAAVQLLCSGNKTALYPSVGLLSYFSKQQSNEVGAALDADARAIPMLVRLLDPARQRDKELQTGAAGTLAATVKGSRQVALACIEAGALPRLTQLAQAAHQGLRDNSMVALCTLAAECPAEVAAERGAIPAMMQIMGSDANAGMMIQAVQSLSSAAAGSPQRSQGQAITEAGGIEALQYLRNHTSPEVREHAGRALARLGPAAAGTERVAPARRVCAAEGCVATRGLKRCARCGTVRYCR